LTGKAARAEFILGYGIDPADLPEGTPSDVKEAVTRLAVDGAADLKTFKDWLYAPPADGE